MLFVADCMIELCFALSLAGLIPAANLYFEIDLQAENIKATAYSQADKQLIIRLMCPPDFEVVGLGEKTLVVAK